MLAAIRPVLRRGVTNLQAKQPGEVAQSGARLNTGRRMPGQFLPNSALWRPSLKNPFFSPTENIEKPPWIFTFPHGYLFQRFVAMTRERNPKQLRIPRLFPASVLSELRKRGLQFCPRTLPLKHPLAAEPLATSLDRPLYASAQHTRWLRVA
jgi:hypothetical protein